MPTSPNLPSKVFSQGSRFLRNGTLYTDAYERTRKIWYRRPTIDPDPTDTFTTVQHGEEFKPELIANRVYDGRYEYGWLIMLANNLLHVRELTTRKTLRIPNLSRLVGVIA